MRISILLVSPSAGVLKTTASCRDLPMLGMEAMATRSARRLHRRVEQFVSKTVRVRRAGPINPVYGSEY